MAGYEFGPHMMTQYEHRGTPATGRTDDHIRVLSSGEGFGADGSGRFAYLDTQNQLGMILEVIEPPTGLGEPTRRL